MDKNKITERKITQKDEKKKKTETPKREEQRKPPERKRRGRETRGRPSSQPLHPSPRGGRAGGGHHPDPRDGVEESPVARRTRRRRRRHSPRHRLAQRPTEMGIPSPNAYRGPWPRTVCNGELWGRVQMGQTADGVIEDIEICQKIDY